MATRAIVPIFELVQHYRKPDLAPLRSDRFVEENRHYADVQNHLAEARRNNNIDDITLLEQRMGSLADAQAGVLLDIMASYRSLGGWQPMLDLIERLPHDIAQSLPVMQQQALAYNKLNRYDEAIATTDSILRKFGDDSETLGIRGRSYKDLWQQALTNESLKKATGYLNEAIATYRRGFHSDLRDYYPGINLVTLLELAGDDHHQTEKNTALPTVRLAVEQRLQENPDYWGLATQLELAVLDNKDDEAQHYCGRALALLKEPWQAASTASNLKLISHARRERGAQQAWLAGIINDLDEAAEGSA